MVAKQKSWDLNKNLKQNNKTELYVGKKPFGVTRISLRGIKKKKKEVASSVSCFSKGHILPDTCNKNIIKHYLAYSESH